MSSFTLGCEVDCLLMVHPKQRAEILCRDKVLARLVFNSVYRKGTLFIIRGDTTAQLLRLWWKVSVCCYTCTVRRFSFFSLPNVSFSVLSILINNNKLILPEVKFSGSEIVPRSDPGGREGNLGEINMESNLPVQILAASISAPATKTTHQLVLKTTLFQLVDKPIYFLRVKTHSFNILDLFMTTNRDSYNITIFSPLWNSDHAVVEAPIQP